LGNESAYDFEINTDWSVNVWVRQAASVNNSTFLCKDVPNNPNWGFQWRTDSGNNINIWLMQDAMNYKQGHVSYFLPDNKWHMFTFVWRGASSPMLTNSLAFIDGTNYAVDAYGEFEEEPGTFTSILNDTPVKIFAGGWLGTVDELGFWSRALTAGEVSTLFNNGAGVYGNINNAPFNSGFVNGLHFDEGTGTNIATFGATDSSGWLYGGATWSNGVIYIP
jgi:hypothetical protein